MKQNIKSAPINNTKSYKVSINPTISSDTGPLTIRRCHLFSSPSTLFRDCPRTLPTHTPGWPRKKRPQHHTTLHTRAPHTPPAKNCFSHGRFLWRFGPRLHCFFWRGKSSKWRKTIEDNITLEKFSPPRAVPLFCR